MDVIKVYYGEEDDGAWIGTSPDAPGFIGHGANFKEAADRVSEGLPHFLDCEVGLIIAHIAQPDPGATGAPKVRLTQDQQPARQVAYAHTFSLAG